jgi:hypothetical protein
MSENLPSLDEATVVSVMQEQLHRLEAARRIEAANNATDLAKLESRTRRLDDFLNEPSDAPRYDIDQLLPHQGNATLQAPKKAGKTTMRDNLVRCFADGEQFLGCYHLVPSVVGIWCYEMNRDQAREWFRELGIVHAENVFYLPLRGVSPSFRSEQVQEWAEEWLRSCGIQVWVLDPAHRASTGFTTKGGDPNNPVIEFTETLDRVKERAGVRNLFLPIHTGLNGEHARSAMRWQDWPDAIWTMTKDTVPPYTRHLKAEGRDVELEQQSLRFDKATRRLSVDAFTQPGGVLRPGNVDRIITWLEVASPRHPSKNALRNAAGHGSWRVRSRRRESRTRGPDHHPEGGQERSPDLASGGLEELSPRSGGGEA